MGGGDTDDSGFERLLKEVARQPSWLAPGVTLLDGRFVIKRLLGSGGMGVVYEATDKERDATVALKTLSDVDASSIYRLKQEFRALADVVHPNLVGLHEFFNDRDQWFFTMDLLPGDTLLKRLGDKPNDATVRNAFAQLARGIEAIHDAGKLHRDLKPTNVMLTPEGRVVILDFGLASDQEAGGVGQTITDDSISGTPQYMAPEQAAAKPASPASDWYAFGVMLFEALTGKAPFEGKQVAVLVRKQQENAPRPSSIRKGTPEDLEQLCLQLLQRDPAARPGWQQIMAVLGPASDRLDSLGPQQDEVPFVGRVQELDALQEAFDATDKGVPVVVFVHGVSGVGKTTLVEQFLNSVRQNGTAVVLAGRCYERESVPYKACDSLIDALSRYLRQLPDERAAAVLPRQIHALAQIFPALQRLQVVRRVKLRRPLPQDPSELRRVAFYALKELLARIAEQQALVLCVDDLQWSDVDGAKLLSSLLLPPEEPALLLIGAYRGDQVEASSGLGVLRERISSKEDVIVQEIALGALSERESQELAEGLLPKRFRDRAARIAEESQGSPFFITELVRFAATGPITDKKIGLYDAIRGRVATLSDAERNLLEAVCVSARPLEQNLLQAATNCGDMVSSLRKLRSQSLIRHASSAPLKFTTYHDRIRAAVLTGIHASRLEHWHRRLACAIEGSPQPDLVALTRHYLGAGHYATAGEHAIKAAEHAAKALAFDQAASMYQVALEHGDLNPVHRLNLQTRLGETLADGGRSTESGRAFLKAAEQTTDQAERGELRRRGAEQLMFSGRVEEGLTPLKEAFADHGIDFDNLKKQDPWELRKKLKQRGYDFEQRAEDEIDPAQLRRLDTLWAAALGHASLLDTGLSAFMMVHATEALDVGEPLRVARGIGLVACMWDLPVVPIATRLLDRLRLISEQNQDPRIAAWLALTEGFGAHFTSGILNKSFQHFSRAEETILKQCTEMSRELSLVRYFMADAQWRLGEWGPSARCKQWLEEARDREDLFSITMLNVLVAITHWLVIDRSDKARQALQEVFLPWSEESTPVVAGGYIQGYCDAYERDLRGWERINQAMERFRRTNIGFVSLHLCSYHLSRSTVALAVAGRHPDPEALLACAEQDADALENPRSTIDGRPLNLSFWKPHAKLIRSGIAATKGDKVTALRLIEESLQQMALSEDTPRIEEACARRRKGQLIGGEQGAALVARAEADLKRLGVVNVPRYCALFAPGFDRLIDE